MESGQLRKKKKSTVVQFWFDENQIFWQIFEIHHYAPYLLTRKYAQLHQQNPHLVHGLATQDYIHWNKKCLFCDSVKWNFGVN